MTESKLKKRIMIFMISSKLIVIAYIMLHWYSGGFSTSETFAVIALIIPLFTVYITAMIKDTVADPYVAETTKKEVLPERMIKPIFKSMTYFIFPVYLLLILMIIKAKPMQTFTFTDMQTAIGALESGLGVYVGLIVFSLFKTK